ncbi:MAG TPA: 2-amino-4-hydroxy-6-hydroxymethyldihydropteridine diphosphokinase [Acidobacteriota bacterium]|nr:2-amino-4-hydroxy-6-hydroxymethyldihydropteridine diphosphokinase [Acidobacteriota bacterium]
MTSGIFLGLGSNIGDRFSNLKNAIRLLGLKIKSASSIYETDPVEYLEQPKFLNQVIQVTTILPPADLLSRCQEVEQRLGRSREINKGPRTIDIDLLLYNNEIIVSEFLTVPHPGIPNRRFVLVPLNEIASDFIHPVLKCSIHELLKNVKDDSEVVRN